MEKRVLMVMPVLKGSGAERVAALLTNEFYKAGYHTEFLLTSSSAKDVIKGELLDEIPLILMQEEKSLNSKNETIPQKIVRLYASLFSRIYESCGKCVSSHFAYWSFVSQYRYEISHLREYLLRNPETTVIAFLQPSIPIAVLAARGLPNKVIISERGDPERLMKKRYGKLFIEKYYNEVDCAVFQTVEAKQTYPETVANKGVVIFNPIKDNLPDPFTGNRNKTITTFCRISRQKNLPLLIKAFAKLHIEHPDYTLKIIGNPMNEDDRILYEEICELIIQFGIQDAVQMIPFSKDVHSMILEDAMYVNSSDYEGMSNAMLEAMAIGMPVICTDCPIGGAHAVIRNEENGLLVAVDDVETMYQAMKRVVEDDELQKRLSFESIKIRNSLSLETISKQWMELL